MSRLSEMIARLCPNGVEYKENTGTGPTKHDFPPVCGVCPRYILGFDAKMKRLTGERLKARLTDAAAI